MQTAIGSVATQQMCMTQNGQQAFTNPPKINLAFFFSSFNNSAMKMKTTSIKLSEVLHRAAKTAAISAGMTFQQWVETAFTAYLKRSK